MTVDIITPLRILIEVGAGDLIDKVTILFIKYERIVDSAKRQNIAKELVALEPQHAGLIRSFPPLTALEIELKAVNEILWATEGDIRECEARNDFGLRFVELARAVYKNNDKRADLKRKINLLSGAQIIEEKSYNR